MPRNLRCPRQSGGTINVQVENNTLNPQLVTYIPVACGTRALLAQSFGLTMSRPRAEILKGESTWNNITYSLFGGQCISVVITDQVTGSTNTIEITKMGNQVITVDGPGLTTVRSPAGDIAIAGFEQGPETRLAGNVCCPDLEARSRLRFAEGRSRFQRFFSKGQNFHDRFGLDNWGNVGNPNLFLIRNGNSGCFDSANRFRTGGSCL
ncbi:MAG: hypothetical protein Edafosvirus4_20 [Edafosvirus sp.]|uniref:Uncharacterized protein n=1 Tax=Edafosvirus sp. TaxID=2487765 RepID=A0A3G4ZT14_9VIRU|nr:MAG: hypothetical protein Edafosvirus4_20 [Edafosvirus sp.]